MDHYPFDPVSLDGDVIAIYNDTHHQLKSRFDLQFTGNIDFQLQQFRIFGDCSNLNVLGSYVLKQDNNNDCYVLFVDATSRAQHKGGLADVHYYQTWALAYLKSDFGRVLIRKETLADKIIELVHPIELDFPEDKAFSNNFYVLVNDRDKAARAIDRNFRNAVMDTRHDDFMIEIVEHQLIIGSRDIISPGKAIYLAEFVSRVCSSC